MQTQQKEIFRLFLILGSLSLYGASCSDKDYKLEGDFYYRNNSAFDLVMRRYNAEQGTVMSLVEEFSIKANEEYLISVQTDGSDNVSCETFRPPIESDSISIEFENGAITSFTLIDNSVDNPLLITNYTSKKISSNYCEFKFNLD